MARIVWITGGVALTKNIQTPKKNASAREALLALTANAKNVLMALLSHRTAKNVTAGLTKFMMKFPTVVKIVAIKINDGSTINVNALVNFHGGIRSAGDVQKTLINLMTNQLVSARVGLPPTIPKPINVWSVGLITK